MKNACLYTAFLIFGLFSPAKAQNLVPNGNFEAYSNCPTAIALIGYCNGWRAYHYGSTDYFHPCSTPLQVGIPLNKFGYQQPLSGSAYTGIWTYDGLSHDNNYKEYLTRKITPLNIGSTYEISMSVSLANNSAYSTNDLGIWFYDKGPDTSVTVNNWDDNITVAPHVSFSGYGQIRDTVKWVRLVGSFVADSAYDNIVIGGFGDPDSTNPTPTGVDVFQLSGMAYYYIDSVVLKVTSTLSFRLTDSVFCKHDSFVLPFTASIPYNSGNIFSLELSDSSGSFAQPLVIATTPGTGNGTFRCVIPASVVPGLHYRVRAKASSPADSTGPGRYFELSDVLVGTVVAGSNTPICTGSPLKLYATNNTPGIRYKWKGPHNFSDTSQNPSILSPTIADSGMYIVTTWLGGCTASDTVNAIVASVSGTAVIAVNNTVCQNDTLKLQSNRTGQFVSLRWTGPSGFIAEKDTLIASPPLSISGKYTLTVFFTNCSVTDTVNITVKPSPYADANGNTPLCAGDGLMLNGNAYPPGAIINWSGPNNFNSTTPFLSFQNVQPALSGAYIFTADLNGCKAADTVHAAIYSIPHPPVATVNGPVFPGDFIKLSVTNIDPGIQYHWGGPSGFSSYAPTVVINNVTYENAGLYIITATRDGCSSYDTVEVIIERDTTGFLNIYPNANNGNFYIHLSVKRDQLVPINLIAGNGQLVYSANIRTEKRRLKTQVMLKDAIASGIYTLNMLVDGNWHSIKLVVVRQ